MKYSIFVFMFVLSFSFFGTVNAEQDSLSQTTINVELIPESPRAGERVYASLVSYATDINSAVITWKINGKTLKTGIGEKTFIFSVGSVGVKTTLGITIKTVEGEMIEKTLVIKPSEIDLIWQSKSYVPPFYKGKAMFSHQNEITFIAIPHIMGSNGQEVGARNLVYTWKKNGSVIEDASGFGKSSYTFEGSLISRGVNIEVEAYTPNSDGIAFGYTSIEPTEPTVIIYQKDPIYGINFQKALVNTVDLSRNKEVTLLGVPFFFGVSNPASRELLYKWSINGVPIGNEISETTQTFRQKEGTSGSSKVSLSVENESKILQYSSNGFNLKLGNVTDN